MLVPFWGLWVVVNPNDDSPVAGADHSASYRRLTVGYGCHECGELNWWTGWASYRRSPQAENMIITASWMPHVRSLPILRQIRQPEFIRWYRFVVYRSFSMPCSLFGLKMSPLTSCNLRLRISGKRPQWWWWSILKKPERKRMLSLPACLMYRLTHRQTRW